MQMLKNKKGFALGELATIGVTFVVIGIVLSMGAKVLSKIGEGQMVRTSFALPIGVKECRGIHVDTQVSPSEPSVHRAPPGMPGAPRASRNRR